MSFSWRLTLGLPHTNRRGFSEVDLMKQAGHAQWQAIAAALGRPLSALRTVSGGEIYAAFYFIETTIADEAPLESLGLDDTLEFAIALRAFKNISIEGRVRVDRLGAEGAATAPHIRFANIFITPVKGNSELKVAPPAEVDCSGLPPLPNAENPFNDARAARASGSLGLFDGAWRQRAGAGAYPYQIDRDRDTNGAGLVYFANYIAFADAAERWLDGRGEVRTGERSLRHRRIAYYGNADIDDRLLVHSIAFVNPTAPRRIGFRHTVTRDSDGALICLSEVVKATDEPPLLA